MATKTKRTVHSVSIISPDENLAPIFGTQEISYPQALKKLWKYMKEKKLYRNEKI